MTATHDGSGTVSALALDTSALLAVAIDGPQRACVLDALGASPVWAASALALTEALPAIDRLSDERVVRADLEIDVLDHVRPVAEGKAHAL